jgi:hypothetical protein
MVLDPLTPAATTTVDTKTLVDGDEVVDLELRHGDNVRTVSGRIRAFNPETARIAELEAELAKLDGATRWEIATDDGQTIGFLPENALTRSGL